MLGFTVEGTGVAGRPREFFERLAHPGLPRQPREYFDGVADPDLLGLLAPTDPGTPDRSDPIPQALEEGARTRRGSPTASRRRQGDDRSARWVERYMQQV